MLKYLHKYANPVRFLSIARPIRKTMGLFSLLIILLGLVFSLFFSPPDYQQKETVRIMYIHVPAAWMSLMIYAFISFYVTQSFLRSLTLCNQHKVYDVE